jgi:hypothetical protein
LKLARDFFQSFVIVVLVIAGICGLLYHIFRQAGWGSMFMDKMFELYLLHPWWMIPLTVLVVIGGTIWHERRTATGRYNKKVPTYVLYALMIAGVYFIGHLAIRGTL